LRTFGSRARAFLSARSTVGFDPDAPRRLSTPSDAFELRPDAFELRPDAFQLHPAQALLETNYQNCKNNLETNKSDLAFVKDNVTITEVSIARVYNWDVKRRKDEVAAAKAGGK
jgi:hypothetical protein